MTLQLMNNFRMTRKTGRSSLETSGKGRAVHRRVPAGRGRHHPQGRGRALSHSTHLKRGCLLMASSGKKRDLEAPPSTGLGWNSGSVNPGQPNLQEMEELKRQNMPSGLKTRKCNTALFRGAQVFCQPRAPCNQPAATRLAHQALLL